MPLHVINLPSLSLTTASTTSGSVNTIDDAVALTLYSPASLTGTITVQVEPSSSGSSFVDLQSGGSDVTLPAGKATVLNYVPFKQIRVITGTTEAADRTFKMTKVIIT